MTSVLQSQHEHYAEVRRRLFGGSSIQTRKPELSLIHVEPLPQTDLAEVSPDNQTALVQPITWRKIVAEVCAARKVRACDVTAFSRFNDVVIARHEIWFRMRHEMHWSFTRIAKAFGPFDHSSVISGIKAHTTRLSQPGRPRVWKGRKLGDYVSHTAAVLTLLGAGKSSVEIVELTGLSKKQVSSVLSDHRSRRDAHRG